jgi:glutamyl-Q tRNA(Asp) synthetase
VYQGRFAPSPTGPLHRGSLVAAVASFLDAQAHGGSWLVRIDDIDPPRAVEGSVEAILAALSAHGLVSAHPTDFQSAHAPRFDEALDRLAESGLIFPCTCTRATLSPMGACVRDCASRSFAWQSSASWRIKVPEPSLVSFEDRVLGPQSLELHKHTPNFIVRRRDGLYAYQLAAAVDDGNQEITHVVRGADLTQSTYRQIFIQHCLDLATPCYAHVPVVTDAAGQKLSKQTGAQPLDVEQAPNNLREALTALGQVEPPAELCQVSDIIDWAAQHWQLRCVSK